MQKELFLFISPHLDDVSLSCGGLIKHLSGLGNKVVAATVFTSDVASGARISWLARRNHLSWALGILPFAARRQEDVNAMQKLGAEHVHLGLLDAMYRVDADGDFCYTKNVVGVPVIPSDLDNCLKSLLAKFQEIRDQYTGETLRVFCPMGLGSHVDHIIVRKAVETFWNLDEIIYYEDYPYAGKDGAAEKWAENESQPRPWKSSVVKLSADEISARVDSVAQYTSQLRGLFPSTLERLLEIAQARIGFFAGVRFPRNHEASRARAGILIQEYIQKVGGEKYWYTGNLDGVPGIFAEG